MSGGASKEEECWVCPVLLEGLKVFLRCHTMSGAAETQARDRFIGREGSFSFSCVTGTGKCEVSPRRDWLSASHLSTQEVWAWPVRAFQFTKLGKQVLEGQYASDLPSSLFF